MMADNLGVTNAAESPSVKPMMATSSAIMDQAHLQGAKACELLLRNIGGDQKIYKEVVPMILKIRDSSVKNK